MAAALARHDALARAAVEGNHGLIWKMTGDGIYAAFDDPLDALKAALSLQQSLGDPAATNGIAIRVRCGLHLGVVERRADDFVGAPVNRATQIMGAAHGGQILLSQALVDGLAERLPDAVRLRDFGRVRLKDLATPEHLFQVVHPMLRQEFPRLRSLESTPNNLPQQTTAFVGRERELAQCKELLRTTRLLTLVGMGGLGKTRLAMQVAADLMNEFQDGVWFIDLAPLADSTLVAKTVAHVLDVREEAGRTITETLCAHLGKLELTLILDNCEHLRAACADLATALLEHTARVRIIATSREALRVSAEKLYAVLPLGLPDRNASLDTMSRSEAVQLFVERARLHKTSFTLNETEAPAVAEICTRLEGIPLALELAAARVRALSVQDINTRLKDRFRLLTGGSRVALERQQTLRAMVGWSYDMLSEAEQRLLERLGVFAGGFESEAAGKVCGTDPLAPDAIDALLATLADKSLVMPELGRFGTRFRQLETIRDFARERLTQRNELPATAARHCDHFFAWAKVARDKLAGAEQAEWTQRLEADLDNVRAAISLALAGGTDPVLAVKLEAALQGFRILRGYATEGRNNLRAALALPAVQAAPLIHGFALNVAASLAFSQSDYREAGALLEEALKVRRGLGIPVDVAATLSTLANVRLNEGDADRARACDEEALSTFRKIGDRIGEAIVLGHLGEVSMYECDDDSARSYFEQCLAIARDIQHHELHGECELALGEIALDKGDLHDARDRFARSLMLCRSAENKRGETMARWFSGKVDLVTGDLDASNKLLTEALRALESFEMNAQLLDCLEDHATLLQARGDTDAAVCLLAAIDSLRETLSLTRRPRKRARWQNLIATTREMLGNAAIDEARVAGKAWDLKQATRYALARANGRLTASAA